jgi:hypothetical protein
MPDIPGTSPLAYIGVFFVLSGVFFIIAGTGIIKVEKISVMPGVKTLIIGFILAGLGLALLIPDIQSTFSDVPVPTEPTRPTPTSTEVIVPAEAEFGIYTGIIVQAGDVISFSASDKWCWGTFCSDANGTSGHPILPEECCTVIEGEPFGKLIGRIGDWVFPIGDNATVTMQIDGDLMLLMNDRIGSYGDNSGAINVKIVVNP